MKNPSQNLWASTLKLLAILSICGLVSCAHTSADPSREFYQAETHAKPYDDVIRELELAITERNFRITGHNHIGSVIRQREGIAFPDYDTLQFCNLTRAREMLEISPAAVVYMPCNVAVRAEGGRVIVSAHLLPTNTGNPKLDMFFRNINENIQEIIDFAVEP